MKIDNMSVQTKFLINRVPERGPHPLWYVYEKSEDHCDLICACAYRKGAESLVERLWESDRTIAQLVRRNVIRDIADAAKTTLTINA